MIVQRVSWLEFKYFKFGEFACKCCGLNKMSLKTIQKLDNLRGICGFPFKILSGCRCELHNRLEGGEEDSAHLIDVVTQESHAADILIDDSVKRYIFLKNVFSFFNRVGIANSFIHVDDSVILPEPRVWMYPQIKVK